MALMPLMQLILYNFQANHIQMAFVLHCWDLKSKLKFAKISLDQNVAVHFLNINSLNIEKDLEIEYLKHKEPLAGVFFDFNCNQSRKVLQKLSDQHMFNHHYHWLIYDELSQMMDFRKFFLNVSMGVNADINYAHPNLGFNNTASSSSFLTYDVYNNGYELGGKLNVTIDREILCSVAACRVQIYLSSLYDRAKYEHRKYLSDITMRVSTVVTQLPVNTSGEILQRHLRNKFEIQNDGLCKFAFQYLVIVQDVLKCHFTYNYTNTWSVTEISGGITGAMAIDHSADIASSPLYATVNRSKYLEVLTEVGFFRQVCMFRTPRKSDIKSTVFLEPFSTQLWWLFLGVLCLFTVALWLMFFVEYNTLKLYMTFLPSFLTACLVTFGAVCSQSSYVIPASVSGRITFITFSLFTYLIYNYYTSIVVSSLLGSPAKSNIKTMEQLANSELEVGLEPIIHISVYFNISKLPEIKTFKKKKVDAKNPKDVWIPVREGLRKVKNNPGFVYVCDAFSGYSIIEQTYTDEEICDLNEVLFRPASPLYFHLPKNTSYREIVKLRQIRLQETGIYRQHYRYWVKTHLNCYVSSSLLVQVGLEYTAPLFIMLASTHIVVLILLIMENFWMRFVEKKIFY